MYFPYLRGRQYELIALRELADNDLINDHVIPIIEPVKISPTLLNTIKLFNKKNKNFVIIWNPEVGSFFLDSKKEKNTELFKQIQDAILMANSYYGVITNKNSNKTVSELLLKSISYEKMVAICLNSDNIENLNSDFSENSPAYSIIPFSPAFRRVRKGKRVMIQDNFNKCSRNVDYLDNVDEFFSDDHLYCYEEKYAGFSDYSIVGEEYLESGFAPFAVAIHIVYFAEDRSLRVHHFVSDSNYDTSDPARKFYEALTKLVKWNKEKKLNTLAMQTFESMYENQTYPGLGVVKKLSIMHHIELMSKYLHEVL